MEKFTNRWSINLLTVDLIDRYFFFFVFGTLLIALVSEFRAADLWDLSRFFLLCSVTIFLISSLSTVILLFGFCVFFHLPAMPLMKENLDELVKLYQREHKDFLLSEVFSKRYFLNIARTCGVPKFEFTSRG